MFEAIRWADDRFSLNGLEFRLEHFLGEAVSDDDCFRFYKLKETLAQYQEFLSRRPEFRPKRIMELGIWDGGSTALWYEVLQPDKYVAVDLSEKRDSPYFTSTSRTGSSMTR